MPWHRRKPKHKRPRRLHKMSASRQLPRPAQQERYVDAALEEGRLPPAIRPVDVRQNVDDFFPWAQGSTWTYDTLDKEKKEHFEMKVAIEGPNTEQERTSHWRARSSAWSAPHQVDR